MTLLEERPEAVAEVPARRVEATTTDVWFDTTDHKRLGLLFVYASLLFLAVSGVVALVAGARQASPSLSISTARWERLYGLHTQSSLLLFLTAIWIGVATYVVPLQIGSGRLALPRLLATGFWSYLIGGGCFLASYIIGQVNGAGITQSSPIAPIPGGADTATTLWVVSLGLIALGFLLAQASLFVTISGLRTDGMTLLRVPALSWATLVGGAVTLVATPVFLGGLLLLGIDQHFGGSLFASRTAGSLHIWQHSVWVYGRPDVYLLTLVALGAATDIVATHARRPILDHRAILVLLAVFAAISLGSWTAGDSVTEAVIVPTYSVLTALVVVPLGLTVLMWLGTVALGRPRFHVSLLFVTGAILLWVSGAANAIGAAVDKVQGAGGGSAWIAGNVHTVVAGPPTLLAFGALYHWAPKIWGRRLNAGLGSLAFLSLFTGLAASGLAYYFLGYNGALLGQLNGISSYQKGLYVVAEIGGALIVLGVLVVAADLAISVGAKRGAAVGDDPYEGLTLEWATSSPPPPWGFDAVPEVRSEAPLYHLRQTAAGAPLQGGEAAGAPDGAPALTTGAAGTAASGSTEAGS